MGYTIILYNLCISQHLGISFIYVPWDMNGIYHSISLSSIRFPVSSAAFAVCFVFLQLSRRHPHESLRDVLVFALSEPQMGFHADFVLGLVLDLPIEHVAGPPRCDVNVDLDSPQELYSSL